MRGGKYLLMLAACLVVAGCGGSDTKNAKPSSSDREAIQESLTEVITRWRHRDKAGLYDNEFEYLQDRMTFDAYLATKEMRMDADTVKEIVVKDVTFYNRDSADVDVEVVFEGPTGKVSRQQDKYRMYYYRERWIRPTLSMYATQLEYEQMRRSYDSAAEAEARELGDN